MSRTFKDRPDRLRPGHWQNSRVDDYVLNIEYPWVMIKKKTSKPKQRKEVDTKWHWMNTPSAWTRLMMNRPMRRAGHMWEQTVLNGIDLEDTDPPGVSRKPHIYYY